MHLHLSWNLYFLKEPSHECNRYVNPVSANLNMMVLLSFSMADFKTMCNKLLEASIFYNELLLLLLLYFVFVVDNLYRITFYNIRF